MTDLPASPDAAVAVPGSALAPSALRDLYLKPSRFFARGRGLLQNKELAIAVWIVGMAATSDRIDRNMIKADLGQRSGTAAAEVFGRSWGAYWALVVFAGILAGYLGYLIGG